MADDSFFDAQSAASGVKARIISSYFDTWAAILLRAATQSGNELVYMDLYCGPGRYDDNQKSTPLLVLEKAIANPKLCVSLVTIFNDANPDYIAKLKDEVRALPGIKKLKHKPIFINEAIGPEVEKYFLENSTMPTFTFIDPFGYVGLTRNLIKGVIKNGSSGNRVGSHGPS